MEGFYQYTSIHARDEDGQTVAIDIGVRQSGQVYVQVTQFEGTNVVWQHEISAADLKKCVRATMLRPMHPTPAPAGVNPPRDADVYDEHLQGDVEVEDD